MTSQKDQIQALIAEIDSVLQRANPRLPWVMSGEVTQQRQVLERVRNYLVSLQQQPVSSRSLGNPVGADFLSQDLYYQPSQDPTRSPAFETSAPDSRTTQQMLDKVLQEIAQLRSSLAPANQPPLNAELLQVLINRLQERLSQQIAQVLQPGGGQSFPPRSDYMLAGTPPAALANAQQEQIQALRARSDQMLVNLDSTINIVFESLQRNIQTYQDSLSQGLERMYSLGQQSEVTFKALVELLIQQLQQEVATLPVTPPQPLPAPPPTTGSNFPYAGTEILSNTAPSSLNPALSSTTSPSSQNEPLSSDAIAAWLSLAQTQGQLAQPEVPQAESSLSSLDLSSLDLGEPATPGASRVFSSQERVVNPPTFESEEDTTEIDAALKLLEMSAEPQPVDASMSLKDAEDHLNDLLGDVSIAADDLLSLPEIPEEVHIELDDFYQSLFGHPETAIDQSELVTDQPEPVLTPELPPLPTFEPAIEAPLELASQPAETVAELKTGSESAANLDVPDLPPLPSSESLLGNLMELEESPTKPDLGSPDSAIAPEQLRFTQSDQISSLSDLFDAVEAEQERSIPVEPPVRPSTPAASTDAPLIEVPFEQTYSELVQRGVMQPIEQSPVPKQDFGISDNYLEDEQYTRAAFEENLLPDAPVETVDLSLDVDELTLNSLNEDLANLENVGYESGYERGAQPTIAQPTIAQPTYPSQPATSGVTLDDFTADLFQEQPPVQEQQPVHEQPPAQVQPTPATPAASSFQPEANPVDFTLEGFATNLSPTQEPVDAAPESSFTLDDFAADLSPTRSPVEPPPIEASESSFTLDDFAAELVPEYQAPSPVEDYASPFTLEGMDDLFEDAPSIAPSPPAPPAPVRGSAPIKEIPPFKPQAFSPNSEPQDLSPFQLEHLDSLFTEAVSASSTSASPPALGLDEAFESLLGPIAPPTPTDEVPPTPQPGTEKKKPDGGSAALPFSSYIRNP